MRCASGLAAASAAEAHCETDDGGSILLIHSDNSMMRCATLSAPAHSTATSELEVVTHGASYQTPVADPAECPTAVSPVVIVHWM